MGGSYGAAAWEGDVSFKYGVVVRTEDICPMVVVNSDWCSGGKGGRVNPQVVEGREDSSCVEVGVGGATVVARGGREEGIVGEGFQQEVSA